MAYSETNLIDPHGEDWGREIRPPDPTLGGAVRAHKGLEQASICALAARGVHQRVPKIAVHHMASRERAACVLSLRF